MKKKYIELNKDDPNYDYDSHDDSLDGRITWSPKGVQFAPFEDIPEFDRQVNRFENGEFITSLTPTIQSGEGLVTLNSFTHTADLEVGIFFDASASHINVQTREYAGEPSFEVCVNTGLSSTVCVSKIPPDLTGNTDGTTARTRRVSVSTELLNDNALEAGSSPRSFPSIPSPYLDDSHVKLFGIWFRQIIPFIMYTSMIDTKFISILQPSRFYTPGDIGQKHYTAYQFFVRAEELPGFIPQETAKS